MINRKGYTGARYLIDRHPEVVDPDAVSLGMYREDERKANRADEDYGFDSTVSGELQNVRRCPTSKKEKRGQRALTAGPGRCRRVEEGGRGLWQGSGGTYQVGPVACGCEAQRRDHSLHSHHTALYAPPQCHLQDFPRLPPQPQPPQVLRTPPGYLEAGKKSQPVRCSRHRRHHHSQD